MIQHHSDYPTAEDRYPGGEYRSDWRGYFYIF
jgi:hypothetical protein